MLAWGPALSGPLSYSFCDLSFDYLHSLFEYKDGMLYWKVNRSNITKAGILAGNFNGRYWSVCINRRRYQVHAIVWIMHGYTLKDKHVLDHLDRNGYNNKIENLRLVTTKENSMNTELYENAEHVYYEASRASVKKWRARPRKKHIGWFETKQEALDAVENYFKTVSPSESATIA